VTTTPESLVMREHESREVALPTETATHLMANFRTAIEVLPFGPGRWRLRTRSTIGTLFAPGLELRILPKCGTKNVLAMLGWAHDLASLAPELTHHEHTDDLRRFLVAILAAQLEHLTRGGLRRGYVAQSDDLGVLRGRLDLPRHLRRAPAVVPTLPCQFEDYTADLPANQAIRYTLERIGAFGERQLDLRLRRLRHAFAIVSRRPFRAAEIDAFTYDRLTAHYRPVHRLCRIILEGLGADDERGGNPLGSFLVDMNALFERFVATWLAAHLPTAFELSRQHPVVFDRGATKHLRADLVLVRDRIRLLLADTKYRMSQGKPIDGELYQVLAYARALRIHHAVLLYPDIAEPTHPLVVRDGANTIHVDGFDLARPWSEVETALHRLLARMLAVAAESVAAA
jgi:5-methylcytosine-specific restriction endonuclease McrBC regulatory subunit McrC